MHASYSHSVCQLHQFSHISVCSIFTRFLSYSGLGLPISACSQEELQNGGVAIFRGQDECCGTILYMNVYRRKKPIIGCREEKDTAKHNAKCERQK